MLLKTLEEPPPGTHFLLVTHKPEAVLQTIRSRCERVAFAPLEDTEAWAIAQQSGWEEPDRGTWTALASGTLRFLAPEDFAEACDQVEAWLALAEGQPFASSGQALLPKKNAAESQAGQGTTIRIVFPLA
jgi:DNA polymerase-3 subunit delta'